MSDATQKILNKNSNNNNNNNPNLQQIIPALVSCSFLVTSQKSSGASLIKLCSQEGIVFRLQNNSCACKLHFCKGIVQFTPEQLPVSLMWELLYPGFLQLLLHRARKAVSRALLTTWQFNRKSNEDGFNEEEVQFYKTSTDCNCVNKRSRFLFLCMKQRWVVH